LPREKSKRRKIWQWLGILLVVCGLGLLGYFAYQKVQIDYYQYRLRKAYEDTFMTSRMVQINLTISL